MINPIGSQFEVLRDDRQILDLGNLFRVPLPIIDSFHDAFEHFRSEPGFGDSVDLLAGSCIITEKKLLEELVVLDEEHFVDVVDRIADVDLGVTKMTLGLKSIQIDPFELGLFCCCWCWRVWVVVETVGYKLDCARRLENEWFVEDDIAKEVGV